MKQLFFYTVMVGFLFLGSCSVTKPYEEPVPSTRGLYRGENSFDTSGIADVHWQTLFADTLLQTLVQEAIEQNPDLKIATTRIGEAEAYVKQARLAFLPDLSIGAVAQNGKTTNSKNGISSNSNQSYQLNLSSSWEADLWGKLKSSKRAALATLLQSQAYQRAVQTNLVALVATYYYQLLALDQQLKITEESVRNWTSTVTTMKALKQADVVTGAAVVQSEASRYGAEVTIPDIKQSIQQTENALSILLGRVPGPVNRSSLMGQGPIPYVQTGVPAQLLSNRPDVQQAEESLRYYFELTNVARSFFYPTLTITASREWSASSLSSIFNPASLFGNVAAGLVQPIFNNGLNKTRLKVAQGQEQEALFNFQKTLLTAGQEVSNALNSYQSALEKTSARDSQIVNLQKAVNYTQQLVRYGSANYTEVLSAQQNLLSSELAQVDDKLQQWVAIIYLYRSLGGGWQ